MRTLKKIILIISIVAFGCSEITAQNSATDFNKLTIGKSYKVLLNNEWDTEGILLNKDSVSIQIRNDISTYTIRNSDILQIVDSDAEFTEDPGMKLSTQADSTLKTIELTDGSELIGYITEEDNTSIKFKTQSGTELIIGKSQIKAIESERSDYYIGADPNQTRLFFAPTGKTLKSGTGYFSVCELFIPMIAFGVTDFITLAGGITIFPFVDEQAFYLNCKVRTFKAKNFDLSAGLLYANTTGGGDGGLTELYAVGTYETDDIALTLGGGLSLSADSETYPILILGGEAKLSKSLKLVSENWIPISENSSKMFSLGIRFFGKHLAGDFGMMLPIDSNGEIVNGWPFVPWVGLNYNFGM